MNTGSMQKLNILLGVFLIGLNVFLFNLLLGRTRVFRLDLTEGGLYTLSDATKSILEDLDEPVNISFYYSAREAQHDLIRPLIEPMKDILSEFKAEGADHVRVEFIELDTAGKKQQDAAANQFGVRPFGVPVKTTFESGVKSTYFSLVVEANSSYKEMNLSTHFPELCRYEEHGAGNMQVRLELADIEYLVSKTIHQLTRSFSSVPGALMAHDQRAEVIVFLSEEKKLPKELAEVEKTVRKVVDTMARQSEGRLTVRFEQPLKDKSDKDIRNVAQPLFDKYKVRPVVRPGEKADEYFYASMVVVVAGQTAVADFSATSAPLESDVRETLEGMIKPLIPGFLPAVGLVVPKQPPPNPMMMQMGQRPPPSAFAGLERDLSRDFSIETVDLTRDDPSIPRKIEVLVLVRPDTLSPKAQFAIDQFLMRGGRLVVFADWHHLDPSRVQFGEALPVKVFENASLNELLEHWGVKVLSGVILDSRASGISVPVMQEFAGQRFVQFVRIRYPMALVLDDQAMVRDHPITASLSLIELFWASPVVILEPPDGVSARVLATTSKDASVRNLAPNVSTVIREDYKAPEDAKEYPLMVVLEGKFPSYFADKPVPGLDEPEKKNDKEANGTEDPLGFKGAPLKRSKKTNIVVLGDSDFLSPMVMQMVGKDQDSLAEHMKLLKNAIDYGGPDSALLSIRNRAPAVRALTALAAMKPDERRSSAIGAAWRTTAISCGVVLLLAIVWMILRARTKRLPIGSVEPTEGAQA